MKQTENSKLALHLPDATIQTNVIKIGSSFPSSLFFTRQVSLEDYPLLMNSDPPEHMGNLIALLFSHDPLFIALEQRLEIMELQGPSPEEVYLLVHKNSRIGSVIDNSSVGLFKYNQSDLYSQTVQPALKHALDLRTFKVQLTQNLLDLKEVLARHEEQFSYYKNLYEKISADNKTLKQEFETGKNAVCQLSFQLSNLNNQIRRAADIQCQLCQIQNKNVLFLPCSHIVGCTGCILPSPGLVCSFCKRQVEDYREIQFVDYFRYE